jgi:hypothetical protein
MVNKYFKVIFLFTFLISVDMVVAQGQSPNHRPPVPPRNPHATPIDAGIIGLLVLGVGYAVKKIRFPNDK